MKCVCPLRCDVDIHAALASSTLRTTSSSTSPTAQIDSQSTPASRQSSVPTAWTIGYTEPSGTLPEVAVDLEAAMLTPTNLSRNVSPVALDMSADEESVV